MVSACKPLPIVCFGRSPTPLAGLSSSTWEHLARDAEQTVHALTDRAAPSQPTVSKHLNVWKLARLVCPRHVVRETESLLNRMDT
jgi:hypothetical protein